MAETIFAKILRNEIPCHKVYEDEHVLAFLDVNPISRGHTLVIPREPAETIDKLSDDASAAIGPAAVARCSRPPVQPHSTCCRTTVRSHTKRCFTSTSTSSRSSKTAPAS